ncbi:CIC11C00000000906 [Sungouiella intermedia]|uniref:CIC11C00000000906 n=1 Tax=Sungouiella intermedia TaxID=45354 RepID=A0A1L0E000_9ASCO|nr:CIC11C00000000906 [[Candida] intermedia]
MSINKVSVHKTSNSRELPFDLFQGEILQFRSQTSRQSISVQLHKSTSAIKVNISAGDGHIFVSNKRFVYITESQGDFDSFALDFDTVGALQFSHALKSPWFGANYWEFMFISGEGSDGFPKNDWFKGQVVFKDGGLFEFIAVVDRAINDAVNNGDIDEELPSYTP